MEDKTNELLRAFNRIDKELDDVYHEVALRMNISDSAFTIFYIIHELGDGCLQKDICREAFANKQTVHSSIQKLEREGYLYLQQGRGRDKHICLTKKGKEFVETNIVPVVQKENEAFMSLLPQEQGELLRLTQKYIKSLKEKLKQSQL